MDIENELKHWGVLGMKWGIRNYQNPDGSLTLLGRLHYGVGPEKNKIVGVNDIGALSDEELNKMTKRLRKQSEYYEAKTDYINKENYYKKLTTPPKRENRFNKFMSSTLGEPLQRYLSKSAEYGYAWAVFNMMGGTNSEGAVNYFNAVTNSKMEVHNPVKDAKNLRKEQLDYMEDLLRKTELEEREKIMSDTKVQDRIDAINEMMDEELSSATPNYERIKILNNALNNINSIKFGGKKK